MKSHISFPFLCTDKWFFPCVPLRIPLSQIHHLKYVLSNFFFPPALLDIPNIPLKYNTFSVYYKAHFFDKNRQTHHCLRTKMKTAHLPRQNLIKRLCLHEHEQFPYFSIKIRQNLRRQAKLRYFYFYFTIRFHKSLFGNGLQFF